MTRSDSPARKGNALATYCLTTLLLLLGGARAFGLGTAFSYQGRLKVAGTPANGSYDLQFDLYDAVAGGNSSGTQTRIGVAVTDGLFAVELDFGTATFGGANRWLQIAVSPTGQSNFTTLTPRSPVLAVPYALYAMTPAGPAGPAGPDGVQGPAGDKGDKGDTGSVGPSGLPGAAGPQGLAGAPGAQGPSGPAGPKGDQGNPGVVGPQGPAGAKGESGEPGPAGPKGDPGPVGSEGLNWRGPWDSTASYLTDDAIFHGGSAWIAKQANFNRVPFVGEPAWGMLAQKGATGDAGPAGAPGAAGPQGLIGPTGAAGTAGPQGPSGPQGPAGPQGIPGSVDSWSRTGNAGTAVGGNFIGTTDNQALEVRVNSQRAFRFDPVRRNHPSRAYSSGINLIGGSIFNSMTPGVLAGTVAGGGSSSTSAIGLTIATPNKVTDDYGTIGGGNANEAGDEDSDVEDSPFATVGGGEHNRAHNTHTTIAGGEDNTASGPHSTVGGGLRNAAAGSYSTIPGGVDNYTDPTAYAAFAAGRRAKAMHIGSFVWADSRDADFTSTTLNQFSIRAKNGVRLNTDTSMFFGNQVRQMLNLWGSQHGVGVQSSTTYFRSSAAGGFAWFRGGEHEDAKNNPGAGGTLAMSLDSTGLNVNGKTTTRILTITGGADLAEPFPMSDQNIPKGAVVVIDDEHPGELEISTEAYDRRVAGIVSGANGINAGITLHQEGALGDGQNVALSGRVYVLADASNGPIKPGDLLTTSGTRGHAMKVKDYVRAQGAVVGKAMGSLDRGEGLLLVIVSLQ